METETKSFVQNFTKIYCCDEPLTFNPRCQQYKINIDGFISLVIMYNLISNRLLPLSPG